MSLDPVGRVSPRDARQDRQPGEPRSLPEGGERWQPAGPGSRPGRATASGPRIGRPGAPARGQAALAQIASSTFSGVAGKDVILTPTAL